MWEVDPVLVTWPPFRDGGGPRATATLYVAADTGRQSLDLLGKYVQSVVRAGPAPTVRFLVK
jgi:hypothetical protein